ncbi:MAG TPA: VOC family protein [Steroidobacteraceae bacterium]|nr:VOC family protein [Steroidobacteraceae bacterium]
MTASTPTSLFQPLYTWHVALVTRHIDECVRRLWDDFGVGPWQYVKFDFAKGDARVYGEAMAFAVQAAVTQVGFMTLGFDQPLSTPNPYSQMIDARGGGAHHLAFAIADEEAARRQMRALGLREIFAADGIGPSREGQAGYFDTRAELGTYIELSKVPAELPPPGPVFPEPGAARSCPVSVRGTSHIVIAVRDLDSTMRNFERLLGISRWRIDSRTAPAVYRGMPITYSSKTATAMAGQYVLMLEQPTSPEGPVSEFLSLHGPAIHRIAFVVDSIAAAGPELAKRGHRELLRVADGSDAGTAISVLDTERTVGVTIELRERPVETAAA